MPHDNGDRQTTAGTFALQLVRPAVTAERWCAVESFCQSANVSHTCTIGEFRQRCHSPTH
eukprot:EC787104.1.p3 GENE.EC787104.1~~EC787104.1.p3  ORF type:complete len:60 (-),score=3.40 EC787104.1:216-395(-)